MPLPPTKPRLSNIVTFASLAGIAAWAATGGLTAVGAGPARAAAPAPPPSAHLASAATDGGNVVAAQPTPDGNGFWLAWSDGLVTTSGDAVSYGDMSGTHMNAPVVGLAPTSDGRGYWLLGGDGGVFSFGDAGFYGSTGGIHLASPALEMVSTADGRGYDFVAADGGVFTFGDARFYGSTGGMRLDAPVVGMATSPDGAGYWLVASDGGVFTFGDAAFHGSTGNLHLAAPVVAMARTADGGGYWLLGRDGGVFAFGDAKFLGSGFGRTDGSPAVGLVATADGGGYWIVLGDGSVLAEGDASAAGTNSGPGYAFEMQDASGNPARWNPCENITYVVVSAGAPSGWQNDVNADMAQVIQATGENFTYEGEYATTGGVPPGIDLVISWSPTLPDAGLLGLTDYWYYDGAGYHLQIVSATVRLLQGLSAGGGPNGEAPVLLHELGHVMGLAQVTGPEAMGAQDLGFTTFQPGDLAGLARLGFNEGCTGFYK